MKAITEAEFQDQVIQLAKLHGWLVAHFRCVRVQRKSGAVFYETPVQADGKGWPDLILIRGRRMIVAELKRSEKEKPTPDQEKWLAAFLGLEAPQTMVVIWTPEKWSLIERTLT